MALSTTERQSLSSRERQRIEDALERRIKSDQAMISYQKELASRGVGSGGIFQEEGPGLGESSALLEEIKLLENLPGSRGEDGNLSPLAKLKIQELREQEERGRLSSQFGTSTREDQRLSLGRGLGAALQDVLDYVPDSMASPFTIGEKKAQQASRDVDASRIEAMPEDSSVFQSPLDAIAAQIKKATASATPDLPLTIANDALVRKKKADNSAKAEAGLAEEARLFDDIGVDDIGVDKKDVAVEDAFMGGMAEYYKILKQEVPKAGNRKDLLKKYMQEFSDATGLPTDGKVDKSQALMAMGLSLMQNRAGSGFNVGKILNAVGQAGEAAMPALEKAKNESKQARIAAGKYALQQIKSDESAVTAVKSANRALYQDLALEDLKHQNEMKEKILEAELEGDDSKLVEALKNVGNATIRIGSQDITLKRGADIEDEGRVVWQDPVLDSKNVATAYRKTTGGLNSVNRMNELLELMSSEAEGKAGGTAFQGFSDKAKEVAKAIGMDLGQYTGGGDVSPRVQYEKLSTALLANFKRYLTSETGNGISTYDVKQIEAALGKFSTFDDIAGAKLALAEIMPMFTSSLNVLEPLVSDFSDRNQYRAGVVGDEQYSDVMNFLSIEFGKTNLINPTQITRDDGTVVKEWDVSY